MKKIIALLFAVLAVPLMGQSTQFSPIQWTASTTGPVQLNSGTVYNFPAIVDTLNLTVSGLGTTATATVHLYVSASSTGPWTTDCPGGSINGAAVNVNAGSSVNLTCNPVGTAFAEIVVTSTGAGTLYGSFTGTNSHLASLPISGGTVTGNLISTGGFTANGFPNQFIDLSGSGASILLQAVSYDQWAITACGNGCGLAGNPPAFELGVRGSSWPPAFLLIQNSATNATLNVVSQGWNTGQAGQDTTTYAHTPRAFLPFSTGQLSSIVASGQYFAGNLAAPGVIENFTATAASFTCTVNPTFTLEDCGTSAGTCATPTALASVTLAAANTITVGAITSSTLTSGDYFAVMITAGTCTVLNASGSAEYRMS